MRNMLCDAPGAGPGAVVLVGAAGAGPTRGAPDARAGSTAMRDPLPRREGSPASAPARHRTRPDTTAGARRVRRGSSRFAPATTPRPANRAAGARRLAPRTRSPPGAAPRAALRLAPALAALRRRGALHALVHDAPRRLGARAATGRELLALDHIIRDEEVLDLFEQIIADLVQRAHVLVLPGVGGHGDQPVVALRAAVLLGLLRFDGPDEARGHEATGEGGLVHEHEHIQRVAVLALGGRHVAEVEGEDRAGGQHAAEAEDAQRVIILELVAAALRRLDDHVQIL